jgi:hypothetical protein
VAFDAYGQHVDAQGPVMLLHVLIHEDVLVNDFKLHCALCTALHHYAMRNALHHVTMCDALEEW